MKRNPHLSLLAGFLAILSTPSGILAQAPVWKGTITKEGDVVVVRNPKEPIYKEPILSLKEDFAIGGAGAASDNTFSYLRDIDVDAAGTIYALDLKERCLKVFDSSAKFLRRISRQGQGPGELGGPLSMTLLRSKNEIYVCDAGGGRRISVFSTDGGFKKQMPMRGLYVDIGVGSEGDIFISESIRDASGEYFCLRKMNADLSQSLAEIVKNPDSDFTDPFKPRHLWLVDEKGGLIYGDAKSYELRYFNSNGKLVRRVLREAEPIKVTKEDKDEFLKRPTPPGLNPTYDFSTHHAAYRSFFADSEGHLFVQTWERTPDRRKDIHDIFDAEGRFIGRIALPCHSDLINPKPRIARAGKLYSIEPDPEGFEVIKRYSLEWKVK